MASLQDVWNICITARVATQEAIVLQMCGTRAMTIEEVLRWCLSQCRLPGGESELEIHAARIVSAVDMTILDPEHTLAYYNCLEELLLEPNDPQHIASDSGCEIIEGGEEELPVGDLLEDSDPDADDDVRRVPVNHCVFHQ